MTKVIKIDDGNYRRLLMIIHELERANNERASFDDAVSLLISEHYRKRSQKTNKSESRKVTKLQGRKP